MLVETKARVGVFAIALGAYLPTQNLNLKKRNPFPCPHHKQKNFGAIMYRTSL